MAYDCRKSKICYPKDFLEGIQIHWKPNFYPIVERYHILYISRHLRLHCMCKFCSDLGTFEFPIRRKISLSLERASFVIRIGRWHASRQHCYQRAYWISNRCLNLNYKFRGSEIICLIVYKCGACWLCIPSDISLVKWDPEPKRHLHAEPVIRHDWIYQRVV